jgi:hypothetical protein
LTEGSAPANPHFSERKACHDRDGARLDAHEHHRKQICGAQDPNEHSRVAKYGPEDLPQRKGSSAAAGGTTLNVTP